MTDKLRITGGAFRGRKLFSPPTNTIRPASDMVRQAVFNMLRDDVEGATFYDIFAGTGIVGMEALSRGAKRVVFVERDRNQISLIRRNLNRAGIGPVAQVRASDAFLWARHYVPEADRLIVYLGPPYPDFERDRSKMIGMVEQLQQKLKPEDILVLQAPSKLPDDELPGEGWRRVRKYGKTKVAIWSGSTEEDDETDDVVPDA